MEAIIETELYTFSAYKAPIRNVIPKKDFTLENIYKIIISDKYKDVTTALRDAETEAEQQGLKAEKLDYVTFSGVFDKRSSEGLKTHSNLFCIDLDDLQNVSEVKQKIIEMLPPSLIFTSPRANGLKVVYKIAITETNTHLKYYSAFEHFFKSELNLSIDESCKDIPRACFLCYDNEAYFNNDSAVLDNSFIDTFYIEINEPTQTELDDSFITIENKQKQLTQYDNTGLKCWDDFNNKNSILDIVSSDLKVVKDSKDKYWTCK